MTKCFPFDTILAEILQKCLLFFPDKRNCFKRNQKRPSNLVKNFLFHHIRSVKTKILHFTSGIWEFRSNPEESSHHRTLEMTMLCGRYGSRWRADTQHGLRNFKLKHLQMFLTWIHKCDAFTFWPHKYFYFTSIFLEQYLYFLLHYIFELQ